MISRLAWLILALSASAFGEPKSATGKLNVSATVVETANVSACLVNGEVITQVSTKTLAPLVVVRDVQRVVKDPTGADRVEKFKVVEVNF